jgi:hypothetical protein
MIENEYQDRSRWFWAAAGLLFVVNLILGFATVPDVRIGPVPLNLLLGIPVSILFIAAPLAGLFLASSGDWNWKKALLWIAGGVALQGGGVLLRGALPDGGVLTVLLQAVGQTGLLIWSCGLGVLVSLLFKEKNIIVPVCIFLAGFDAWLIFNPHVFTSQLVQQNAKVFQNVAMQVPLPKEAPKPAEAPEKKAPKILPLAYIGPADLIFSTTFFAVLFRFRMKVKESLRWLVPVLAGYLALVFVIPGGMLPALVPIGITILLVNRGEFKMNAEEKQGVWGVTVLAVALAAWGIYARVTYKPPVRPVAPSPQQAAPAAPAPAGSPAQASRG